MKIYEYRHLRRGYRGYRSRTPSTHEGASTQPKPKKLPSHQGFKWNRYLIVVVARSRGRTPRFSGAGAGQATPAHLSSAFHASNPPHPLRWGCADLTRSSPEPTMPPSALPDLTTANQEATAITGAATRSGHHPGEQQPKPPPTSSNSPAASPHRPAKERPKQPDRTGESAAGETNPGEEDKPPRANKAPPPPPAQTRHTGVHKPPHLTHKVKRNPNLTEGAPEPAPPKTPLPTPAWRRSIHLRSSPEPMPMERRRRNKSFTPSSSPPTGKNPARPWQTKSMGGII